MEFKRVTAWIRNDKISELVQYIKSGANIEGMCFLHLGNELAQNGISSQILQARGALLSLAELAAKLNSLLSTDTVTIDIKNVVKHYDYALSKCLALWEINKLHPTALPLRELNNYLVAKILKNWQRFNAQDNIPADQDIHHLQQYSEEYASFFYQALLSPSNSNKITSAQCMYYTTVLEKLIYDHWEQLSELLSPRLEKVLLDNAMHKKLDHDLQQEVENCLRKSLRKHIISDIHLFQGLSELGNSIINTTYKISDNSKFSEQNEHIVTIIMENYHNLNIKAAQDIQKLLIEEVIPQVVLQHPIPERDKHAVASTLICDFVNKNLPKDTTTIQSFLDNHLLHAIKKDICSTHELFHESIKKYILMNLAKFKSNSAEHFKEFYDLHKQAQEFLNPHARIEKLEAEIAYLREKIEKLIWSQDTYPAM